MRVVDLSSDFICSPVIASDSFFNNCLVYIEGRSVVVRSLPMLEEVRHEAIKKQASAIAVSDDSRFALLGYADGSYSFICPS